MSEYRTISIPKELIDKVEEVVTNSNGDGYRTIAEFCSTAIREKLTKVKP